MVQIYRRKWQRGILLSFFAFIRDAIVLALPIKRLSRFLARLLYGLDGQFAFLAHPRFYQDIFIAQPFLNPLKLIFRKREAYSLISRMPPTVLNTVRTTQGVCGIVVAQAALPEFLLAKRKVAVKVLHRMLRLVAKVCRHNAVVGLGGWFPMVCRGGRDLECLANELGLRITNGHCGTLASIYMTLERIAEAIQTPLSEFSVAVFGVGRMGSNVARVLSGRVRRLLLVDIHEGNLHKLEEELRTGHAQTKVDILVLTPNLRLPIRDQLKQCHVGVCATSTFRNLVALADLPVGFVAIDDSRPEALPRDPKNERIILEGGLLKLRGAHVDYNYGFGQDDNVFGCLGEAFLLALDRDNTLSPTLAEVDNENFFKLLSFCKENGISAGDLKSSELFVSPDDIRNAFERRKMGSATAVHDGQSS